MPAAFDERERESIRRRLLDAALDALARGGLAATSVAELARSALIAKGSFYIFFSSKEELFMEALESMEDRYRARFAEAACGTGSAVERLERAFRAAFYLIETEPALRSVDAATMERLARALPPDRLARHAADDAEASARLASEWRRQGLIADDVEDSAVAAASYAVFLVAAGLRTIPVPLRAVTEAVVIRGLACSLAPHPGFGDTEGASE